MIILYAVGLIAVAVLLYAVVGIVMTCGDEWIRRLQRWVNNKYVFKACERFEDYER